jgi:hypothetical protein
METTIDHAALTAATLVPTASSSKTRLWVGRVLTGLPALFLVWDGLIKFLSIPQVVEASERVGFHRSTLPVLGAIEIVSVILISIRRTAAFGAVLISAYLGGAVATHVRLGDPLFSHTLFPIYFAALIWGGLYLRNERIRALSPFKS